jgi:hypothetical protein
MRVLGWVLAGALALTVPIGVQAGSLGPGWYPMPNGWNGDWRRVAGPSPQWKGSGRRVWAPNGPPGGWVPYPGPGVPTYWVWGPSGGAFDYPFADWRGPTGGWGNP